MSEMVLDEAYWRACISGLYEALELGVYCQGSYDKDRNYTPRTEWQDGWNAAGDKQMKQIHAYRERCLNPPNELWPIQIQLVAADECFWAGENNEKCVLLVNDVFAWGCADAEDVADEEWPELYAAWLADKKWGTTRWCCIKRNEQPQKPVKEHMQRDGCWDVVLDALPANYYDTKCAEDRAKK